MGSKKDKHKITEEDCQTIIKAIFDFKKTIDPIDDRASKKLAFLLGEYCVLQKVFKKFPDAVHMGGQSHCDITIPSNHLQIEVKTSTWKDSRAYHGIKNWGWTVETRKQCEKRKEEKDCKPRFNFVIAVALDEDTWKKPEFFIISWKDAIKENPYRPIKGLSNIIRRIELFKDISDLENARELSKVSKDNIKSPTSLEERLVKNPQEFQNWDILKNTF